MKKFLLFLSLCCFIFLGCSNSIHAVKLSDIITEKCAQEDHVIAFYDRAYRNYAERRLLNKENSFPHPDIIYSGEEIFGDSESVKKGVISTPTLNNLPSLLVEINVKKSKMLGKFSEGLCFDEDAVPCIFIDLSHMTDNDEKIYYKRAALSLYMHISFWGKIPVYIFDNLSPQEMQKIHDQP